MNDVKIVAIVLLVIATVFFISCKKKSTLPPSSSGPGANEVWMQNTAFTPASITVALNTTITWTNKDNMNHNVTSSSFQSSTIASGGTYSHVFATAGTYNYNCTFHAGMNGTVIVQ
jgi:plastocyanin